jgi:hypothetical protein
LGVILNYGERLELMGIMMVQDGSILGLFVNFVYLLGSDMCI